MILLINYTGHGAGGDRSKAKKAFLEAALDACYVAPMPKIAQAVCKSRDDKCVVTVTLLGRYLSR